MLDEEFSVKVFLLFYWLERLCLRWIFQWQIRVLCYGFPFSWDIEGVACRVCLFYMDVCFLVTCRKAVICASAPKQVEIGQWTQKLLAGENIIHIKLSGGKTGANISWSWWNLFSYGFTSCVLSSRTTSSIAFVPEYPSFSVLSAGQDMAHPSAALGCWLAIMCVLPAWKIKGSKWWGYVSAFFIWGKEGLISALFSVSRKKIHFCPSLSVKLCLYIKSQGQLAEF